ncbi:ATP-binding cassette domain-containing protein [Solimonas flava]|uniref:ATP-binding cassette domain-containing protein n=1 Tax=Solimonas flava TaxID=415849 RepID=UPI00041729C7|nr:ATP-binding cassette domain-containing protein [Solimonas flava]
MEAAALVDVPAIVARGFGKRYRGRRAVSGIDLSVGRGELFGLIGPDGAGKSSLIKAAAGVLSFEEGELSVFGQSLAGDADAERIKDRIGLMPQGLGQNLYAELSIDENIDFFAQLRLVPKAEAARRKAELLAITRLERFRDRAMKHLSGGMKQKLGLVCTLIHEPQLVLLDEPTTGVDPVSRRDFWAILGRLLRERGITALVSTAYMDEASSFHRIGLMFGGQLLAQGTPEDVREQVGGTMANIQAPDSAALLQALGGRYPQVDRLGTQIRVFIDGTREAARAGLDPLLAAVPGARAEYDAPDLEDSFIALARQRGIATLPPPAVLKPASGEAGEPAIVCEALTRDFGAFRAVDAVSFDVHPGEIFGLLGANGAGKSTVIKMLTGILQPSAGRGRVAGADMRSAGFAIKERIGYMSQAFSLYLDLTVEENVRLYGDIYGVDRRRIGARLDWVLDSAELRAYRGERAARLPLGLRQRLALGCALVHEPRVLFLDEPTSGVDPIGRRAFWTTLQQLARNDGVAILLTTHYMLEAERCDRLALMYAGRVVAADSPAGMKAAVERESGVLLALDCAKPEAARALLERRGYAYCWVYGAQLHVLTPQPERDLAQLPAWLDAAGLGPARAQRRSLSMEDVFVHRVTALEAADRKAAKAA